MGARRRPWSIEVRRRVGAAVAAARAAGDGWKALEHRFGRGRVQLWRCVRLLDPLMKQNRPLMKHQGPRQPPEMAPSLAAATTRALEMSIFGGSTPAPPAPPPVPTLSDPAVTNAARQEQLNAARARGRAATILTGGMGAGSAPPVAAKILLGQ